MSHDQAPTSPRATGAKEILVVDDTPSNLRLLLVALSSEGYQVRCAKSAALALTRVQAALPDLVLLDIRMPQMNGYEFCTRLKADARTREIPVIFLSVLDGVEDKVRAFGLGGVDYIAKPYQIDEVLARVRYQFQARQQQQQLQVENDRLRQENAEQQQSLTRLEQSYQMLSQVLNSLADGVAAFRALRNQQGEIEDFQWLLGNAALADWLGRSPAELAGATLSEILTRCPNDDVLNLFIQVVEQHETLQYELLCEPDGEIPLWFELMAIRLGDGLVARLKNITEYHQVVTQMQTTINELQILTTQDGLTQIANRRAFNQYLEMEWQRLTRTREPLSLIMGDIDHFKRFNDLCGHGVGDECLRQVAAAIASVVKRPADLVARYGGEEFAILLPQTTLQGAARVADQVLGAIAHLRLVVPRVECERVSLSLGVASQIPGSPRTIDMLLAEADRALYRAKGQGGNRVCLSEPAPEPGDGARFEVAYDEEE
ncbi:diguanylate cyclase [Nodosilinea sp. PGN35]|uniref:diguanylate cyclase n=1 Tax=Nodosilinea sp. PGN35 TaxID=3020489 RepID=UPI0023B2CBB2|nr:diguanylate cyclase [Nodosilinea sp. TSF1-S3]MDF0366210.1 diguanylate cyclase [Nodosilinea sp. TSF1-S3]